MSKKAENVISKAAKFYLNTIVNALIVKLKRAKQSYRLNPDCILNNLWEEICVQQQEERWTGYDFVEDFIEAQISLLIDDLPEHVKLFLLYESKGYDLDIYELNDLIKKELYLSAASQTNKRIDVYLRKHKSFG